MLLREKILSHITGWKEVFTRIYPNMKENLVIQFLEKYLNEYTTGGETTLH